MRSVAAAILVAISAAAHAADAPASPPGLRTLFHTAAERDALDRARRGEPAELPDAKRAPPVVTGFVKRSDGRDTVWLDGRAVTGAEAKRLVDPAKGREETGAARQSIEIKRSR